MSNIENWNMEDMEYNDLMQEFNDLYYNIGGDKMGIHERPEDHPKWKEMEKVAGRKVGMQEVANWGYRNLK